MKFLVPLSVLVSLGERFQWRAVPAAVQPAVAFVMQDVLAPAAIIVAAPVSAPQSRSRSGRGYCWPSGAWGARRALVLVAAVAADPSRAAPRDATALDAQYGTADLAVMSSPSMPEPGVVGICRPRLLLPEGIVERLTPAQLRTLIAHERCHIRCHDNLTAAIHMAVEALFWFHPVVWWIESRLVDERERACDEAVFKSGNRPRTTPKAFSRSAGNLSDSARMRGRRERLESARACGGHHAERDWTADDACPTMGARGYGRCGRVRTSRRRCADRSIAGRRPSGWARVRSRLCEGGQAVSWPGSGSRY